MEIITGECRVCLGEGLIVCLEGCSDHGCCFGCWGAYVKSKVNEGVVEIPCVELQCPTSVSEDDCTRFTGPEIMSKYKKYKAAQELEANPQMRWCINPHCGKPVFGYKTNMTSLSILRSVIRATVPFAAGVISAGLLHIYSFLLLPIWQHSYSDMNTCPTESLLTTVTCTASEQIELSNFSSETINRHWDIITLCASFIICCIASGVGMHRALSAGKIWSDISERRTSKCEDCGTESCFQCKQANHPGRECSQIIDPDFRKWVAAGNMRAPCHGCRSIIELRDGCNHMTCVKCGYQFCMLCGESIAGRVSFHYSHSKCTRYHGVMTESWKQRCWEFGSTPVKFTKDQVNQLAIPCGVVLAALVMNSIYKTVASFAFTVITPSTPYYTAATLTIVTMMSGETRSFIRMTTPVLSLVFVEAAKDVVSRCEADPLNPDFFGIVILKGIVVMATSVGVLIGALLPHVMHLENWSEALKPKPIRPFQDINLLALVYGAGMHSGGEYAKAAFSTLLCFGICVLGAMSSFAAVPYKGSRWCFWSLYRNLTRLLTVVSIFIFFDVAWSLRGVLYIVIAGALVTTPTHYNRYPFSTAILGYVQQARKKSLLRKTLLLAVAGLFLELAYQDSSACDGTYLFFFAKVAVLNIAPLALLSMKHSFA